MAKVIVAILTVRKAALDKFRTFEKHAASVMRSHGGRLDRTVVVATDESSDLLKEVHIITFPSAEAYADYRQDRKLGELAHLREAAVVHTEVLVGEDGPVYDAG